MTADHAHTSQIVESQPYYALSTVLKNADGSKTTISYGTSEKNLYSDGQDTEGAADSSKAQGNMSHTGTQLRIAASGPGASRVDGLTDQTDTSTRSPAPLAWRPTPRRRTTCPTAARSP